jgi:hypothetical protein
MSIESPQELSSVSEPTLRTEGNKSSRVDEWRKREGAGGRRVEEDGGSTGFGPMKRELACSCSGTDI